MGLIAAKSVGEYLSAVRELRKRWKVPAQRELWFRAEDSAHRQTHLQPQLYRPRESSGLSKSVRRLLELENNLYEEFRRCSAQLSDASKNSQDWEWDSYFLMQHHGVPTRLLDWSDGALIALHFAIARKQRPPRSGAIIYVFDPDWLLKTLEQDEDREDAEARWKLYAEKDKTVEDDDWPRLYLPADDDDFKDRLLDTPAIPMLWDSPHFTRRIAAQRSRFMIFGSDPLWLAKLARQASSRIASIGIPVGAINKMKLELRDAGITESVVFPDLDGLGRELKQIWEMRR